MEGRELGPRGGVLAIDDVELLGGKPFWDSDGDRKLLTRFEKEDFLLGESPLPSLELPLLEAESAFGGSLLKLARERRRRSEMNEGIAEDYGRMRCLIYQ